ncbi:hypothetical protein V6183_15365 [Enterobacter hormaechei]|uniref:structural cement protein Gp24 n=1 Tax=Enterobacter cloacae complex TaxID=354276 RepID=UPI002075122A|nr:hypothetical protein [Enterobacter roggenkampii]MCM7078322.1 hypothetical protein [Enterobacter roggenkampii]
MAGKAYLTRMALGFVGAVTRPHDLTAEAAILDVAKPFPSYGLVGKYVGDKFVPLTDGDAAADVVGIFMRPYPTTNPTDARALGVSAGYTGDVLKRGYICVSVPAAQATAAKKGGKVYVRVSGATDASPLGSLLLAPDSTAANTPELTTAKVMGPGDNDATSTHGTAEIAFNI